MYTLPLSRIALVREGSLSLPHRPGLLSNPEAALDVMRALLADRDRETFVVLSLGTRLGILGASIVSIGTVDTTIVHPREVFKPAILANAAGIIVGHNHPSGNAEPTKEDRELTDRLVHAGRILGIPVHDHIIIGADTGDWVGLRSRMGWYA
jgi:DNA repair protein RadC